MYFIEKIENTTLLSFLYGAISEDPVTSIKALMSQIDNMVNPDYSRKQVSAYKIIYLK